LDGILMNSCESSKDYNFLKKMDKCARRVGIRETLE